MTRKKVRPSTISPEVPPSPPPRFKLGKLAPKPHPKTLLFSKYVSNDASLPRPTAKVYREYKTPPEAMQMFGNDTIGDCTCAGIANLIILMTVHTGAVVIPTLDDVIGTYSAVTGYVPGDPSTDRGAAMTDVLAYMQSTGMSGHKILAWAKIDHTNQLYRELAVDLFGATYVGVNLPMSAQEQFGANQPWKVVPNDPIEGGHAIIHPGYGRLGGDYVSWARWDQKASSAWEAQYIEEEYVIITEDWINQVTQLTPGGVDLATLQTDIKLLSA